MRKGGHIEFVDWHSVTDWVPMLDAYKFKPRGRFQWLQRVAWRLLSKMGALEQAMEPKATITRHQIDGDKFIERILKQRRSLFNFFRKDGQRLLIGSEDYAELMGSPEVSAHMFSFDARIGYDRSFMGLRVEVVPWMRGAVLMP